MATSALRVNILVIFCCASREKTELAGGVIGDSMVEAGGVKRSM